MRSVEIKPYSYKQGDYPKFCFILKKDFSLHFTSLKYKIAPGQPVFFNSVIPIELQDKFCVPSTTEATMSLFLIDSIRN